MKTVNIGSPIEILLVEDNPGDVRLTVDLDQFLVVVKTIEDFWLTIVKLPPESA